MTRLVTVHVTAGNGTGQVSTKRRSRANKRLRGGALISVP